MPQPPAPLRAQLRVIRKETLTPHYIRVYLGGPDVHLFAGSTVGVNNKILIPPPGVDEVHFPQFNVPPDRRQPVPEAVRPVMRTYTHRGFDPVRGELWIDFVVHGLEGPASAWALNANPGDVLGVLMKPGTKELHPQVANYLLVGDATAIPVLGAILEGLPPTASGECLIEVHGPGDEQPLPTASGIRVTWLHNPVPQQGSRLAERFRALALPAAERFAYVAAEYATVRAIRQYLRREQGWQAGELYAFSYWKAGQAEDRSSAERHAEREAP